MPAVLPAQNPAKAKAVREVLGKAKVKQDVIAARAASRRGLPPCASFRTRSAAAYLQTLLLTGARPGEVLSLRWADVNEKWKGLTIRDKVEGERVIPADALRRPPTNCAAPRQRMGVRQPVA